MKKFKELFCRAVKLNPTLVEAWNELGESYTRHSLIALLLFLLENL
jgi:hypothetical protein